MRLKKNDTVKIIAGKDKGVTGKIIKVDTEKECVYVQGANMVSKTMKKRNQQDKGGITQVEAPIHVSNVALVVSKNGETSKVGFKKDANGNKVRYAKKTGEVV
ncbi:MAG: 50S ribosomal protein L24 [Spirochaetales bacterium]|jgi:large subunit ribosomal protein L24|nr:50S ribosomal protein L24 [Spirochaetales bacterium]MBQ3698112.1 50S ribosomal protein L24 [Spirochaetales bacterium]MBQ3727904.1 50S ribosomal protein L24 [Spirochaetales bacterium]MBQ3829993.1 50S ribosomal protein L24 [Spirochaetales bacterium]MBQ6123979.1 50S ribosomal protein L24 [Spirochaetales bacterium]